MREPMIRALVVEDEPMILKYIVKKINELDKGFEVIDTAINGQEALKKIYESGCGLYRYSDASHGRYCSCEKSQGKLSRYAGCNLKRLQ